MTRKESTDVTLALVDTSLLSCWEEMVKQGAECSLLLKHNKGKVIATLQCTTSSVTPPSSSSAKKKKSMGNKEKKLERLLAYHQRLVVEKGLPPSRLMEQHAAASSAVSGSPSQSSVGKLYPCDQCDFATESQRGLKVHVGRSHKSLELPQQEKVRDFDKTAKHLEASPLKDIREELPKEQTCFECGGCGEFFDSEDNLNTHIENIHSTVLCSNCKMVFWEPDQLWPDPDSKPLACPFCFVAWPRLA